MIVRSLGVTALALTLTACASASGPPGHGPDRPRDDRPHGQRDGGPMGGGPQLFISPAGEPFRAPPGAPYPVVDWFNGADANHDGALRRDEFVADSVRFFNVLDMDHNGVLDGFEVSNYENHVAPEIIGGAAPSMRRGPRGLGQDEDGDTPRRRPEGTNVLQGAALFGLIAEPEPIMAADSDFDGRITKDEAIKAAKTRFALLDVNKDGVLKLDELPKTPAQTGLAAGRGGRGGGGHGGRGGHGGGRGGRSGPTP